MEPFGTHKELNKLLALQQVNILNGQKKEINTKVNSRQQSPLEDTLAKTSSFKLAPTLTDPYSMSAPTTQKLKGISLRQV